MNKLLINNYQCAFSILWKCIIIVSFINTAQADIEFPSATSTAADVQDILCESATTDKGKKLCKDAIEAVYQLDTNLESDDVTINTCYCNEGNCPLDNDPASGEGSDDVPVLYLDISLNITDLFATTTATPFAYTDCSGWLSYLLQGGLEGGATDCTGDSTEGYCDVASQTYNTIGEYPKAFVYQKFFKDLANNGNDNTYWDADDNLANLEAGDVLAWCLEDFCQETPPTHPNGSDSGHIMLVLAIEELTVADNSDILTSAFIANVKDNGDDAVKYFKVAVVDASSLAHANNHNYTPVSGSDTVTVYDSRQRYGDVKDLEESDVCTTDGTQPNPPESRPDSFGGLGSGTIYFAQWQVNGDYYYTKSFTRNTPLKNATIVADSDTLCTGSDDCDDVPEVINMAFATAKD